MVILAIKMHIRNYRINNNIAQIIKASKDFAIVESRCSYYLI